jgi:hypothetical protein
MCYSVRNSYLENTGSTLESPASTPYLIPANPRKKNEPGRISASLCRHDSICLTKSVMEDDDVGPEGSPEEFSPVEVLKQQFLTYAHTVCRPQTPLPEKIQALHRYENILSSRFYHSMMVSSSNLTRSPSVILQACDSVGARGGRL